MIESKLKLGVGITVLVFGLVVYMLFRLDQSMYLTDILGLSTIKLPNTYVIDKAWIYNIPAFLHVFSMSLITASIVEGGMRNSVLSVSSWVAVNWFFELMQHPFSKNLIYVEWGYDLSWFKMLDVFIRNSFYDTGDMIYIFVGGISAFITLMLIDRKMPSRK